MPGYEGRYEVSDHGLVRGPDGVRDQQVPNKDGYIVTSVDGHKVYIHRLVCLAFHGAPTGPEVRHLDGNPGNNRPSNLAWGTAGENALDRVRHGRDANAQKTHCKHGHSLEDAYLSPNGERECRECRRLYRRAWNMKQKGMMCLT